MDIGHEPVDHGLHLQGTILALGQLMIASCPCRAQVMLSVKGCKCVIYFIVGMLIMYSYALMLFG